LHEAKLVMRFSLPLIIKFTGIGFWGSYVLKCLVGILLIVQVYRLSNRLLHDNVASTFVAAGLVFIYFGKACFLATATYDGLAFFCLITAMLTKRSWLIFLLCTFAAWSDERAFLALPIVFLFHQMNTHTKYTTLFRKLTAFNSAAIAVIVTAAAYIALRIFLTLQYNLHTPTAPPPLWMIKDNLDVMAFGLWSFFEGFWLLLILGIVYALVNQSYLLLLILAGQFIVSGLTALAVADITRSGSYLVPLIFIFLLMVREHINSLTMRYLMFMSCLISFIFPAYYIIDHIMQYRPIYHDVFDFVLKRLV
jgi:hypothetical protein